MKITELSINNTNIQLSSSNAEQNKLTHCKVNVPCFCGISCCLVESMCGIPVLASMLRGLLGAFCCKFCLDGILEDRQIKIFSVNEQPIIRQPERERQNNHVD
jgi:hypothetical protein